MKTGCAATGLALSLLGSPIAHADDASFVRDAQALGFVHSTDNLISTAQSACYFLTRNRNPSEVEQRIVRYTRIAPPAAAHQFFILAVKEYCPQYEAAVSA